MKLLLAVYDNDDALEKYFKSINDLNYINRIIKDRELMEQLKIFIEKEGYVEVCGCVRHKKNLYENVVKYEPDTIVISHNLPGDEDIHEIISKLTSSKDIQSSRIIYLYGADDKERRDFINFLISNGIFDYYVGDVLDPSIINNLLINSKTRDDVKNDIISNYQSNTIQQAKNDQVITPIIKGKNNPILLRNIKEIVSNMKEVFSQLSYEKENTFSEGLNDEDVSVVEKEEKFKNNNNFDNLDCEPIEQAIIYDDNINNKALETKVIKKKKRFSEVSQVSLFNNITMVVSICSLKSGIGCTHIAKSLAYYIKNFTKRTVCIVDMKGVLNVNEINGIDVFQKSDLIQLYDRFNYIILDVGKYEKDVQKEIIQSHIKIMCAISEESYFLNLAEFVINNDNLKKWKYIFNHVPEKNKQLRKLIIDRMENFEFWCMPVNDAIHLDKDMIDTYGRILKGEKL